MVQARGTLRASTKRPGCGPSSARLTERHESTQAAPWAVSDAPEDYVKQMLGAIVGIEIELTSLVGKWKVSQNRDAADRAGVAAALGAHPMAALVRGNSAQGAGLARQRVMRAQSPLSTASAGVSHEPPQTLTLGSARNCGAVSGVMPPVGQNSTSGNGPGQRLQHRDAAGRGGREELQEAEAVGVGGHHLAGRGHAGQQRQADVAAGRADRRACSPG